VKMGSLLGTIDEKDLNRLTTKLVTTTGLWRISTLFDLSC
jgi:hypothetical protein